MAVLKNKDGTELYMDCLCGCDQGIRFRIDKDDLDYYCAMSYTNGIFYSEQRGAVGTIRKKVKKILAIIRNKDYYYSDVTMTKEEFDDFKEYINSI